MIIYFKFVLSKNVHINRKRKVPRRKFVMWPATAC